MYFVFADVPPDRLILLFAHRLGPLTKRWAAVEGTEEAMATQTVALSCDVRCILDDQLVVGSESHVFCSLQETLHAALLFVLQ